MREGNGDGRACHWLGRWEDHYRPRRRSSAALTATINKLEMTWRCTHLFGVMLVNNHGWILLYIVSLQGDVDLVWDHFTPPPSPQGRSSFFYFFVFHRIWMILLCGGWTRDPSRTMGATGDPRIRKLSMGDNGMENMWWICARGVQRRSAARHD